MSENITSGDVAIFDNLEPIQLTINAEVYEVQALRRPLIATNSNPGIRRANWHIDVTSLSVIPVVGSTFMTLSPDINETWEIVHAERMSLTQRWKMYCVLNE